MNIEELLDEMIKLNEAIKEQTEQIMEMEKRIVVLERVYGDKR